MSGDAWFRARFWSRGGAALGHVTSAWPQLAPRGFPLGGPTQRDAAGAAAGAADTRGRKAAAAGAAAAAADTRGRKAAAAGAAAAEMWNGMDPKSKGGTLPRSWESLGGAPLSLCTSAEYHHFPSEPSRLEPGGCHVDNLVQRLPGVVSVRSSPTGKITCHPVELPPASPGSEFGDLSMGVETGLSHTSSLQLQRRHVQIEQTMRPPAGNENPLEYCSEMPAFTQSHMSKTLQHDGDHLPMYGFSSGLKGCDEACENNSRDSLFAHSVLRKRIQTILIEQKCILWSDLSKLYKRTFAEDLPEVILEYLNKWTDICHVKRFGSERSGSCIVMLSDDARMQVDGLNPSGVGLQGNLGNVVKFTPFQSLLEKKHENKSPLNDVLKRQLCNLLKDHRSGIWLKCLPNLFFKKYNQTLPEEIIQKYECLSEIFDLDMPLKNNPKSVILHFPDISEVIVAPAVLPKAELTFGKISWVRHCEEFYIQFETDFLENDLRSISNMLLNQYATGKRELAQFVQGTFCSFEISNSWYRGQVQSVDVKEQTAIVFAIDYGFHTSCVRTEVCKLPPACARLPAQCVRCCLRPMGEHGAQWASTALRELNCLSERLKVKVEEVKGEFAIVVLYTENGTCVNEKLCSACVQIPSLTLSEEDVVLVSFVTAESTNEVIVRYCSGIYACQLNELIESMNLYYGSNKGRMMPCFSVNELVAVHAEERGWLRASVVNVSGDHVEVMCVDLGLSLEIKKSDVRQLEDTFCSQHMLALVCQLAGLEYFCRDKAVLNCLCSMAYDHILHLKLLKKIPEALVVLYDPSGANINAACLRALEDRRLALQLEVNVTYRNVYIQHVTSDGFFFCQMKTNVVKKVDRILSEIEKEVACLEPVHHVFSGMRCLVQHVEGRPLVRAEILHVQDQHIVEVYLTDYGKRALIETSSLLRIGAQHIKDLVEIPAQVVKCRLAGAGTEHVELTGQVLHWLRSCVAERHGWGVKVVSTDYSTSVSNIYLFINDGKHWEDTVNCTVISRALRSRSNVEPSPSVGSSENPESFEQRCTAGRNSNGAVALSPPYPGETFDFHELNFGGTKVPRPFQLRESSLSPVSAALQQQQQQEQQQEQQEVVPPLHALPLGKMKQVFVSAAHLPSQFVMQLCQEMPLLDRLMNEMEQHYRSKSPRPATGVQVGKIYATRFEDDRFYRVVVKGVMSGMANVYQLDYGEYSVVPLDRLLPLPLTFRTLPIQGVCAELFGTASEHEWSVEAATLFGKQVKGRSLWALFMATDEDPSKPFERKACVDLIDTSQDNDVYISQLMLNFKS
ncbi:tudor domain-containing protein 7 isoform X2 [Petromyzon marinus]|uniref:tudor domain-containing protein 7 isoform X2 n=1 Tax=Petromyzon marinus TaxID=7757 RepID=UPI003F6E88DB